MFYYVLLDSVLIIVVYLLSSHADVFFCYLRARESEGDGKGLGVDMCVCACFCACLCVRCA